MIKKGRHSTKLKERAGGMTTDLFFSFLLSINVVAALFFFLLTINQQSLVPVRVTK
jgi:hypothetical protein